MRIVIIGSGTALPQRGRSAPCCLVRAGAENLVVDLGPGAIWGLMRHAGVSVADIDIVLMSHLHMDHCADLAPLLFALRSGELARSTPLRLVGPPGLKEHYGAIRGVWKHWVDPVGYDLVIEERAGRGKEEEGRSGSLRFRAAPTGHSQFNLAWLVLERRGGGVLFTGDGEATEDLVLLGRSAPHILVSECSAGPGEVVSGHLNPEQAGALATACGSLGLVLTHFNPGPEPGTVEEAARRHFSGKVVVAEDGMVIDLESGAVNS